MRLLICRMLTIVLLLGAFAGLVPVSGARVPSAQALAAGRHSPDCKCAHCLSGLACCCKHGQVPLASVAISAGCGERLPSQMAAKLFLPALLVPQPGRARFGAQAPGIAPMPGPITGIPAGEPPTSPPR